MKYFLWAGTLGVLALFGFTLSGLLSAHHPSLAEQTQSAPASTPTPALSAWTPPERSSAPETLSEHTDEAASTPAPTFDDPAKEAALQQLVRAKEEMQSLRPPQITSTDPAQVGAGINAYVNAMGQRAQAYNQARTQLQEHLSKAEAARLNQILAQPGP